MDPNENLHEQLRLAREIVELPDGCDPRPADVERLAEMVIALDEWVTKGGFIPERWAAKPEPAGGDHYQIWIKPTGGSWQANDRFTDEEFPIIIGLLRRIESSTQWAITDLADGSRLVYWRKCDNPIVVAAELAMPVGVVCAACRKPIGKGAPYSEAKDGALFHRRCWNNA